MRRGLRVNGFGALSVALVIWVSGPDSPVADAAQSGDLATVRSLLRAGADVNAAQGDGMTALHWSALNNDVTMIQVLLYAGATVEPTTRLGGYTPLHLASRSGLGNAVRALLGAGSRPNTRTTTGVTALHFAAEADAIESIQALVDHGADVNARDAYSGRTPLMFATARSALEATEVLLAAGADVSLATNVVDYPERSTADGLDRRRRERVMAAARPTSAASAETRTQATPGTPRDTSAAPPDSSVTPPDTATAPPDSVAVIPEQPPEEPDSLTRAPVDPPPAEPSDTIRPLSYTDLVGKQGGMTALHYAARDGQVDAVRRLLDAGADINRVTDGDQSSPLLVAVINGHFDLAMKLLEWGADPNLASEDGAQPLFATLNNEWALRTWYPQPTASRQQRTTYLELMEALLEAGVDPDARVKTHIWYAAYNAGRMGVDFAGATPFWRAAYATDVAAMRLLVKYGADPNIPTTKPAARRRRSDTTSTADSAETDPSGLEPVPVGGPAVHPLHAASGVGYGTSRVGQQHRHVPDGWLPAVMYLVDSLGVDVNVRDHEGYSAVHHAAARGDNEVIRFLVERGADVTFVSRRGQTTVDMANGPQQRVQPFPETIALLESLGAKNNNNCLSC